MDEIVFLDLSRVDLYGWEEAKSDQAVDSIVRGIEADDMFQDPVQVYRIDGRTYQLTLEDDGSGCLDGGHKRAVGHYIAHRPLMCIVRGELPRVTQMVEGQPMFNVRETILEDDDKMPILEQYAVLKQADPNYR